MVQSVAVAPKIGAWFNIGKARIIICQCLCLFPRNPDRFNKLPVTSRAGFYFVKRPFARRCFIRYLNDKKHVVNAFLNDTWLVQIAVPDNVDNQCIACQVSSLSRDGGSINIAASLVNIGQSHDPPANRTDGLIKR